MLTKASTLLALLTMTFAGCAMVSQDVMNTPPHAMSPRSPDSVEVFTAGPPARARVDVAVIHVNSMDPLGDMRQRAADLGCDGLVLVHGDTASTGTCIVYTEPATAAR
jgi:hypothetical protein